MQIRSFIFMLYVLLLAKPVNAQSFNQLNNLPGHSVQVYYSKGFKERAFNIANRVDNAMVYYQQLLDFRPTVNFLVLDTSDWSKYTSFPVYGMPHYSNDNTLVVAAVDNPFWKSFIPPLDQLPADLRSTIQDVYKNDKGEISMQAFFDLLALHELGHAYMARRAGCRVQSMGLAFMVMVPMLYGVSWSSREGADRDGSTTRFVAHVTAALGDQTLGLGIGHQDFTLCDDGTIFGLGSMRAIAFEG